MATLPVAVKKSWLSKEWLKKSRVYSRRNVYPFIKIKMSAILLKRWLQSGKKIIYSPKLQFSPAQLPISISKYSSDSKKEHELQSGTILIQDGSSVQELPLIIRKVKDIFTVCDIGGKLAGNPKLNEQPKTEEADIERLKIVQDEFKTCQSLVEVFSLLSKCEKLTPVIAFGSLERLYKLDILSCRPGSEFIFTEDGKNSIKAAIVEKMLDVVRESDDVFIIIETFMLVALRDSVYREKYLNEILVRVVENKLTISQACKVIEFLGNNPQIFLFSENIDKFWVVFSENEKEFDEKNLTATLKILPYLKESRNMVLKLAEKKMHTLWWNMPSKSLQDIIDLLHRHKISSHRILNVAARWVNTNIHSLTEDNLVELVAKFTALEFNDHQMERALERYVKAKSVQIKSDTLVVTILNHCATFRLRNPTILSGCAEYFIAKGENLPPMFIKSFIHPFGWLRFQPTNGLRFWEVLERILATHLENLNPSDVLDLMMACIYLEKYPLNFVDKIFTQYFLERINSMPNADLLRTKLKLLDTAMTLECSSYAGPRLPKDRWAKSLWIDARIRKIVNLIKITLSELAGSPDCYSTFVIIPSVFTTELYLVDILFHPKGLKSSILNLNLKSDRNVSVAVLVHPPEHYCFGTDELIGPQAMRIKHMRLLGMKVTNLKYDVLSKLRTKNDELKKYVVSRLKAAQPSI